MKTYCSKCKCEKHIIYDIVPDGEIPIPHCQGCGDVLKIEEKTDFKKQAGNDYESGELVD